MANMIPTLILIAFSGEPAEGGDTGDQFADPLSSLSASIEVPPMPAGFDEATVRQLLQDLAVCPGHGDSASPSERASILVDSHGDALLAAVAHVIGTSSELGYYEVEAGLTILSGANATDLAGSYHQFVLEVARLGANFAYRSLLGYQSLSVAEAVTFAFELEAELQCKVLTEASGLLESEDGVGFAIESIYAESERLRICAAQALLASDSIFVSEVTLACELEPGDEFYESVCAAL